jgi:hypothetical protein
VTGEGRQPGLLIGERAYFDPPALADQQYGGGVESPEPVTFDLDKAEAEIRQRWFVWTAAGLTVHPVTWNDQNSAAEPAPRVRRSEVQSPRSMGVHVSRPSAHVDIVLYRDGWTEVAVLRPGADAVIRATAQVESVAGFGALVDRAVELITWSGVRGGHGPAPRSAPPPERAAQWVVGYDGNPWSSALPD